MSVTIGCGQAIGHHGEIIQGVFDDDNAKLRRGLVSLPCRHLKSTVTFHPDDTESIEVSPANCGKAKRAAELTLSAFGPQAKTGGQLTVRSNIPVGYGMGSSTADVLASIFAVLDSLNTLAPAHRLMQIAVEAETACDSTLFNQQAVLFAHRDGVVIEPFQRGLPPVSIVSVNTAPEAQVDTLDYAPARYDSFEIEKFRPMRSLLRQAVKTSDSRLLGRVATASAQINERFLPKPYFKDVEAIGDRNGAVGIQVAHSGTVVGLMFDAMNPHAEEGMNQTAHDLRMLDLEPVIYMH